MVYQHDSSMRGLSPGMASKASAQYNNEKKEAGDKNSEKSIWELFRELKAEREARASHLIVNDNRQGKNLIEDQAKHENDIDYAERIGNKSKKTTNTVTSIRNNKYDRQGQIGYLNDKLSSLFSSCPSKNNEYLPVDTRLHFHSPNNVQHRSIATDYTDVQHTQGVTESKSGVNRDYVVVSDSKSKLVNTTHETSNNLISGHAADVQHTQGVTESKSGVNHDYVVVSDSKSKIVNTTHETSNNLISGHTAQQMKRADVFSTDRNTNWTPTSESVERHQPYPTKNYHEVSREIPYSFEDVGSCVDGLLCNAEDCSCKRGHWSPYFSPLAKYGLQDGIFEASVFDNLSNRRFVGAGRYRSPSSTESDPISDDFEVVKWNSKENLDFHDELSSNCKSRNYATNNKRDSFNTAPNSPELDLSHLDGWHTAPNTPRDDPDGFCMIDPQEDFEMSVSRNQPCNGHDHKLVLSDECRAVASDTQVAKCPTNHNRNSKQSASETTLDTFTKDLLANLPRSTKTGHDILTHPKTETNPTDASKTSIRKTGATENVPTKAPVRLFNETPIIYSGEAVEYSIDSVTEKARTCGKGSFGQVYIARFSDQSLYHIPIVVKEFDKEFTSKKEILLEAQRLMYLQDTGYVPICYGMIELSAKDKRSFGIIQEFVGDGTTLEQILWDRMKMPVYNWLTIALQCCDGLARFHDKGILLNDIKSNNIIVIFYGNGYVCIKYIDFGLATDMRGRNYRNTKSLEDFVYIAPEVRLGRSRTNVASDIFSLGYMLDQIYQFADVAELKFVADLCMNDNPHCRIPVKAAVSVIEEQMEGLEIFHSDTQSA